MDIESKRTLLDESIDSGEFFLGQLRQRIQTLQTKRDTLKSSLAAVESEERTLRIQQNKLEGLLLSQDRQSRQELEDAMRDFKASEEHLWASRLEKEEKCKKLQAEIDAIRRKRGLP